MTSSETKAASKSLPTSLKTTLKLGQLFINLTTWLQQTLNGGFYWLTP
jgi:hypothetical protein